MTHRPHMPLSVKLAAAILQLGLDPKRVDFDHDPALGLRHFDEATGQYDPPANDPKFITIRARETDHKIKTNGTAATSAGSDKQRIAKVKRFERVAAGETRARPKRRIPQRANPWPPKGSRKFRNQERIPK